MWVKDVAGWKGWWRQRVLGGIKERPACHTACAHVICIHLCRSDQIGLSLPSPPRLHLWTPRPTDLRDLTHASRYRLLNPTEPKTINPTEPKTSFCPCPPRRQSRWLGSARCLVLRLRASLDLVRNSKFTLVDSQHMSMHMMYVFTAHEMTYRTSEI